MSLGGAHLCSSSGERRTRLLLSSAPSTSCLEGGRGVGSAILCSKCCSVPHCCPPTLEPSEAAGHRDEAGRTLPAGLVPNSSWLLHSGLQEELPDPHSLAACKEPRC